MGYAENRAIKYETPAALRKRGLDALCKELDPVGMARFISQYEAGEGDYTSERAELHKDAGLDDLIARIEERRRGASPP